MTLKEALLAIADGDQHVEGWNYKRGLCANVASIMKLDAMAAEAIVQNWAKDWPHATQPHAYPVPYTAEELHEVRVMRPRWHYKAPCSAMYDYHSIMGTLYSDSYYGKMRRDLARHIAGKL